jgi:hypothetical protein
MATADPKSNETGHGNKSRKRNAGYVANRSGSSRSYSFISALLTLPRTAYSGAYTMGLISGHYRLVGWTPAGAGSHKSSVAWREGRGAAAAM